MAAKSAACRRAGALAARRSAGNSLPGAGRRAAGPRLPAEILHARGADVMQDRARIIESNGQDVTPHYQLAAWLALRAAQEAGCEAALLTDGSPTCGSQFIYDGTFSGQRKPGSGVAAALLREHGIAVFPTDSCPNSSPGCNREKIAMIHCKRVYDPAEAGDGYRVWSTDSGHAE